MIPVRDQKKSGRFPAVTFIIVALNIWAFWQLVTVANQDLFIFQWALVPAAVNFQEPGTLIPFVTSQFLHGGFFHILFNMWYLWIFANNVEARLGKIRFFIFYISAGIVAAFVQYAMISNSPIPMLGASGAVAGVLGAYLRMFPSHKIEMIWPEAFFLLGFSKVIISAKALLIIWFILQLFSGAASVIADNGVATGGVAWWAHIGGFAFGWFVGHFFRKRKPEASNSLHI